MYKIRKRPERVGQQVCALEGVSYYRTNWIYCGGRGGLVIDFWERLGYFHLGFSVKEEYLTFSVGVGDKRESRQDVSTGSPNPPLALIAFSYALAAERNRWDGEAAVLVDHFQNDNKVAFMVGVVGQKQYLFSLKNSLT